MALNVGKLISELQRMTVPELRRRYEEVFGEQTRSRHKEHLIRRIVWRVQALEEGDFIERAQRISERALEIADDADLRMRPPATTGTPSTHSSDAPKTTIRLDTERDDRLPMPGALLTRVYRGRTINVRVLPNGFDYDGTVYRSLSAVARAVTGAHWNGYLFFGLNKPGGKQ